MAAVLASGDNAALSHLSAAELWGIYAGVRPRWPHVSVPTSNGRRGFPGIKLHRAPTLDAENDITERNHIPVTTLERTLLDITTSLDAKRLKSALRQSERIHKLDLQQLHASLDAIPKTNPKRGKLMTILNTYIPGESKTQGDIEPEFLELCQKHRLPLPTPQYRIGTYYADFAWPDLGLVVEIDDRGSHDGYVPFQDDLVRQRAIQAAGFEVSRFTRIELRRKPAALAAELRATIARLRSRRPDGS